MNGQFSFKDFNDIDEVGKIDDTADYTWPVKPLAQDVDLKLNYNYYSVLFDRVHKKYYYEYYSWPHMICFHYVEKSRQEHFDSIEKLKNVPHVNTWLLEH
jgi:hypothetical protein